MSEADRPLLFRLAAEEMDPILMEAWGRKADPREIFDPTATTVVIEHDAEGIAGFFVFCQFDNTLYLNTLVIKKTFQGRGLGKQVMKWLEDVARNRRLRSISLCVQTNNQRAMHFYRKLGFRTCGTIYANTLLMRKKLDSY
jgi:ribosomal protein S18 acetylase RimI-like enzyme